MQRILAEIFFVKRVVQQNCLGLLTCFVDLVGGCVGPGLPEIIGRQLAVLHQSGMGVQYLQQGGGDGVTLQRMRICLIGGQLVLPVDSVTKDGTQPLGFAYGIFLHGFHTFRTGCTDIREEGLTIVLIVD